MSCTVTCYCCGYTKEFKDGEEAFREGWDAPPHFTQIESCDLCPTAFAFTGIPDWHLRQHEKWKQEGRPDCFNLAEALSHETAIGQEQKGIDA